MRALFGQSGGSILEWSVATNGGCCATISIQLFTDPLPFPRDYPSFYSHRYLHDRIFGRDNLGRLDAENRRNMDQYVENIHAMEELTRLQVNLVLLRAYHARNLAART